METFFNNADDLEWLFDTHLKGFKKFKSITKSFLLSGNEDCPNRVELFDKKTPLLSNRPILVFIIDENNELMLNYFKGE